MRRKAPTCLRPSRSPSPRSCANHHGNTLYETLGLFPVSPYLIGTTRFGGVMPPTASAPASPLWRRTKRTLRPITKATGKATAIPRRMRKANPPPPTSQLRPSSQPPATIRCSCSSPQSRFSASCSLLRARCTCALASSEMARRHANRILLGNFPCRRTNRGTAAGSVVDDIFRPAIPMIRIVAIKIRVEY